MSHARKQGAEWLKSLKKVRPENFTHKHIEENMAALIMLHNTHKREA
jgi:hypothetical protein